MLVEDATAKQYLGHTFRLLKPGGRAYFQNRVGAEDACAWFPKSELAHWWQAQIAGAVKETVTTETVEIAGRIVEVSYPCIPAALRSLNQQVSLIASAGFTIEQARVVTPGANSPFEVVLIAAKNSEPLKAQSSSDKSARRCAGR